ncbi:MAG TPA: extracellular solute-binding protein [Candidatus Eisenbergiella pullicola]|nr:extracellular solute-binding protein [Candidatus Eisenbergiella pullicola]
MKQWRKWMAAGLTAVMAVSTAACGSTGGTDSASSGEEQTNFSIFAGISALSPDNSEKPLVQQMNEAMGVTIEWNCVSGDTLTEKKNLILNAGSDLPDALMAASLTDSELLTYGGNGLLIPLEDYINEETMPNLMKIVEKRPEMLATCTMPDGHIYGLPGISEMGFEYTDGNTYYIGAIPQFTAINTDWLEEVGMEMPTTVDELHDVLVAFKENDVNGNGDPTDEIPLSFIFPEKNGSWCAGLGTLLAPFGCTDYQADHRAIENGQVYYQAASEEYKNAIAYYHDWFEEGLIDIEIFSQDSSQYIAKGNGEDPRLGVFVWWEIPEVVGEERAESYEYLPILEGPDGTYGVNLNEMGTTSHNSFSVTNACENPELLLKWVDQMYDPINSMQAIYGPIGVYWDEEPDENGCYSMRELKEGETAGELKSKSELLGPTEQLTEDYGTYYYLEDRAQERLNDLESFWFNYVDSTEYYPSVTYTADEIEVINDKLSDIKALTEEKVAHWLRDGGIEEEWDQYLQDLDNMGLQEVVGAWQAAYDRYQEALAE